MFTIEMDWDEIGIRILDPECNHEDLELYAFEDTVYIRQWCEDTGRHIIINISPYQLEALSQAFHLPEGAYKLERK